MTMSTRRYENTRTQFNGGYPTYWSLIFKQGPQMLASIIPQLKERLKEQEKLCTGLFGPLRLALVTELLGILAVKILVEFILKLPWWLLIKPLGSILFHRVSVYHATTKNDNIIIEYDKTLTIYLFRTIPIYGGTYTTPSKKDLEYLFKEKASEMVFEPVD